jgi:hypothetical protein
MPAPPLSPPQAKLNFVLKEYVDEEGNIIEDEKINAVIEAALQRHDDPNKRAMVEAQVGGWQRRHTRLPAVAACTALRCAAHQGGHQGTSAPPAHGGPPRRWLQGL